MSERDLANLQEGPIAQVVQTGAVARKSKLLSQLPCKPAEYFQKRRIHIHDFEYYDSAYNCIGINPSQLIGSCTGVRAAFRELFRKVIALTNQQSGGIGFINFDEDMGQYITAETDQDLEDELWQFLLDLNTFVRKGCERAYVTLNIGLATDECGRRIAWALLKAFARKQLVFPNIVFKLKQGINTEPNDPNYDLFCYANQVTAQCMNPTYLNTDASFNQDVPADELGIMGCRTRMAANLFYKPSSLRRGNIAAVTINLVQLALESNHDSIHFQNLLLETMDVAKEVLLHRMRTLASTGNLVYVRQNNLYLDCQGDTMEMLRNGTLSIGFIGLWDAVSVLYETDMTSLDNLRAYRDNALNIIKLMRECTDTYTSSENLNFSLLASSAEGVTGFFCQYDSQHYPEAVEVCSKGHYTNSFHVPVECQLNCFEKMELEGPFHALCNGGHITYIELAELPRDNPEAIRALVRYACSQDIGYFGINFPLDICQDCGEKATISHQCPKCGSANILRLRRVSGYLSDTKAFTAGKQNELRLRHSHMD